MGTLPGPVLPAAPPGCATGRYEHARLQWWLPGHAPAAGPPEHGEDPARVLEDFLCAHGLAVRNLHELDAARDTHQRQRLCGAAVFISAAAGAVITGAPPGPPSPVPAVPDLVAVIYHHGPPPPAAASPQWRIGAWRDSWTPRQHAEAVEQARAAIGRGDFYQVNLVGHASAAYLGDPLPALTRLAGLPGAAYGGVLSGPGWAIGCASPETLVQVAGGQVSTRPIKGTRPATATGRRALLTSAKERAEHIMIVDLERNDLARIAATGSVCVEQLYALRSWCGLWQAESHIRARLADGVGLIELLRAVCPGGSVTGAPKLAALAHIGSAEPVGRGASMGALGWIGPDGVDLGLTIRTAAAAEGRVHLWAGGGITYSSDPAAEVAEAGAKAAPLRAALAAVASNGPGSKACVPAHPRGHDNLIMD